MNAARRMEFEIAATAEAVDSLCARIDEWLARSGMGENNFAVAMLLRESLNNALLHGCGGTPKRFIRCGMMRGRKWLEIMVEDNGPGFRRKRFQECAPSVDDCHGRGLQIYRLYADQVRFNRRGNRVTLRRRISGGHSHDDRSSRAR